LPGLAAWKPNSRFHVSKCTDSPGDTHQIPVSEFPSFRGPSVGPQRDPKNQIPCFQVCRFQDTPLQIPDSEFPSFQGPSVGPRRDPNFQIPCFLVGRFQDTPPQIPDSKIPSVQIPGYSWANSRFRVSEFPRPPLGSKPKGAPKEHHPQIPDSEFPSFRGSLFGPRQRDSQIPPNSRFRVSEFPRTPLGTWVAARGTRKFPDSEFPSVIPRAYVRREQIPEYTAQFLFPLLYSCVAKLFTDLRNFGGCGRKRGVVTRICESSYRRLDMQCGCGELGTIA
jgi:hypothetical protein